jgi:hypothetical protein
VAVREEIKSGELRERGWPKKRDWWCPVMEMWI